jgi:hypothetical protein
VTWSVSGGGALSDQTTSSATYTAPTATTSAQTITITATSVADTSETGTTTLTVPAAPLITTTASNLAGAVGTAYSVTLAGSGGISPYTWTVASGSTLPAGLSLSTAGVISGTPLAAGAGTTNVAFVMTDSGTATPLSVTQTLGITITAAPAIAFSGTMPATATYNAAYTGSAAASGGVGTLTYSLASGALPTGLSLNAASGAVTGTPTVVNTFNFTIKAADAFGDSNTQSYLIVVSAAVPTLTFAAIPAETYGNASFTVSASSASSGAITYSVTSGPATIAGSTVTLTGAGTVMLGASQAASGNYGAATGSATFTVGKATATINVTPYSLTYDANAHTATGTATGVGGANLNADLTLSGTTHTSAGTYASDAWSFTDPSGNYANASGTVSDLISKATATINVTAYSVTYDGNVHTASATATGVGGANLNADLTLTSTTHTNAGTYASDAWSFTDPSGNYANASGTVSDLISKATATINVTAYSVTYDGNVHTASATATGVGGATLSATDFTLTGTTHTNAGTYAGDAWSFTDPNYASASGIVSDKINQATATVVVTGYTVTFDSNPHTASATATGANGVTLSATDFTLTGTTHTNVGTYAGDAWSFTDPNYASASGTVSDAISKATATINVTPYSVTYDGNAHTATATATGAGGVSLIADLTLTGTTHTNAGPYASDAWSFTDPNGNYASVSATITDKINQATAAIIVTGYTVIYDGNPHTATGTATGVGGANLNADLTLSGTTHTDAASYATDQWTFTDATGNYANTSGTVTDTINGEVPNLIFNSIPFHYVGDAAFQVTATDSSGPVSSGAITYSLTPGQSSVGTVNSGGLVTMTGVGTIYLTATQAANGNYAQTTASAIAVISPALSITNGTTLPTGVVGNPYSQTLTANGGNGNYTWSLVSGGTQLAGLGLTFNPGTAGVGATASVTSSSAILGGPVSFTVQVSDNASPAHTVQATFTVTVSSYSITTTTLSPNYVYTGSSYSATINALGGTSPYTWTVSSGGSALTAAGLSLSTGTGLSNMISGNVPSGATTGPINFTVKVVDANGISITQAYSLTVYGALSLTTPSTTVPGPAVIGQSYTGNNIFASGGNGSYSWAVTGLTSALGYNNTGNPLVISGTPPTTSQTINASVTLTDTTTGMTYGPIIYNIVVAPLTPLTLPVANPTSLPSATINQQYNGAINASGGSGSGYVWSINGTAVPTDGTASVPLADGLGAFSTGGNTLTISGTPATAQTVTLTNVTVTDSANDNAGPVTYTIPVINPNAGYTVSGTIIYPGSKTGWVYLELSPNSGCSNCNQDLGTAINASTAGSLASPGMAFTIHGVPAGTYTLKAWMDNLGYGALNASDPSGNLSNLTVTSSGLSGQSDTLHDPSAVSLGTLTPTWDPSSGLDTFSGGAVVSFDPICNGSGCNNGGIEMPTSYNLQYSTSSTFSSGVTTKSFPANGGNSPWIVSGLTNGQTYYFRAAGVVGSTVGTYSVAEPTGGLTINVPSTGSLLSGTVTYTPPAGVTLAGGPLYVGCYASGTVYIERIASPVSPQPYSVYVPNGTSCQVFGFIDQYNSGLFGGPGEISNTNNGVGMIAVTVNGATPNQNITLPSGNSTVEVKTQTYSSGSGSDIGYNVGFQVYGEYKMPVAVELLSGTSAVDVVLPADIATGAFNGNRDAFDYWPSVTGTPVVGDSYTFNVTYADGTSEQLTASVNGVLSAFATNLSPTGTGASTAPNFSWDYPSSSASSYLYQFELDDNNGNTIWEIPSKHSNSNGFASTMTPFITWDVDPTNTGDLPSVSSLNTSYNYNWSITAYDSYMNAAKMQVSFQAGGSTLSLPTTNPISLPATTVTGETYNGSVTVTGGIGPYNWQVNNLSDNLGWYTAGSDSATLMINGTPNQTGTVTFQVTVTDNTGASFGPETYTITVNSPVSNTYSVAGYINFNGCGGGNEPPVTLALTASGFTSQTTATNGNGVYNFTSVPNGTYTLTPSITGAASSAFVPASQTVVVNNSSVYNNAEFTAYLGYTVSGVVGYNGADTGQIYTSLTGCGSPTPGTSISAPGAFTIRGVPPGQYTLNAWMDNKSVVSGEQLGGYGVQNASNPTGSTPNVLVINANVPDVSVGLANPSAVTLNSAPTWYSQWSGGFSGGAFVTFSSIKNNGIEVPDSYTLEYSTDSTFQTGVSSKSFPAIGGNSPWISWIVTGLSNSQTYYFRAAGVVGSGSSAVTGPYSAPSSGMLIGAPSGGNAVSGKVTIPTTITPTGPLYVGFFNQDTGNVYAEEIASPTNSASGNSYLISVPTGSNYFFFAVLDQNNDGMIDPGDVTNINGYNMITPPVAISTTTTQNLTLPSANSWTIMQTENDYNSNQWGSGQGYNLDLIVSTLNKMPVSVALLSGSNILAPMDIALCLKCTWDPNSRFSATSLALNTSLVPTVGNAYSVQVAYSDGTSETLTPTISGVLPNYPTNLSPAGPQSATNTTPTLTWSYPATNADSYTYQMWFADSNWNTVWSIPNLYSATNPFTTATVPSNSITWSTDPTGVTSNTPTTSILTNGEIYYWEIAAYDVNGNRANYFVDYVSGFTSVALPTPNPSSLGPAFLGQSYSGSITATGGYSGYNYSVNGTNCFGCTGISLGNGLSVTSQSNGILTITGTPNATGPVTFTVYAQDTSSAKTSGITYTINITEQALSLPAASSNPLGSALVSTPYAVTINASGGSGNYSFTVNGTTVPTSMTYVSIASGGDGLTVANSGGNTLWFAGTPSAVASLSLDVVVADTSNTSDTASVTYTLPVINGPNGANNSYLNGTYVCKLDGYFDKSGSRWAALVSFQAGGAGTFTNGVWDQNSRDLTTEMSGTMTGTYSIGADNNGLLNMSSTVTSGGSGTHPSQFAIALNNTNPLTTATEFRMVESDDVGASSTNQHGTGDCYLATTNAFAAGTISGHSFAFGFQGEDGNGVPKAKVGRFSASGGNITSGIIDGMRVDQTGDNGGTFTGSYTTPSTTTGRSTLTIIPTGGGGSAVFAAYVIDANRMFLLETAGDSGVQAGDMRTQQQTSYSDANLSGPFVMYAQGYRMDNGSPSRHDSQVSQVTGNGAGGLTLNQSYMDDNGTYSVGNANGGPVALTFDSTYAGRVTFPGDTGHTSYLYFYDNSSALYMDLGSSGYLQTGWVEPQTQTTFTDAALAGNYLFGQLSPMQATQHGNVGELNVSSGGVITGGLTEAGQGVFSYDQSQSMGTLTWDSTAPGTGTFLIGSGDQGVSCAVISATKIVCTLNADSSPAVLILQQ